MTREESPAHEHVEGRNPVLEALRGPRRVHAVFVARGVGAAGALAEIISLCEAAGVPVSEVPRERIDDMAQTASPQGVIAEVSPYRYYNLSEIASPLSGRVPMVLVLDGVEDPHNLGSILRVADAGGADGVVIARRRAAHVTAVAAKASAGAVEHVRVARVANIPSALLRLKEHGFWVVGADSEGGVPYYELDLDVPLAIVLGGEGGGVGRLVKERCDHLVSLPMLGGVSSLNVAAAAAVIVYEVLRQRGTGGPDAR